MAGVLEGLVIAAPEPPLLGLSRLPQPLALDGLWFLPLSQPTRREATGTDESRVPRFLELTESIASFAASASIGRRTLYLLLEFHGGQGTQEALGWRDGQQDLGPLFTKTAHELAEDWYLAVDARDMAINVGLRWLGAAAISGMDEFTSAGLDRHRWTDEWDVD